MPHGAVVDEQGAAQNVSPDQRDDALPCQVRAENTSELALETDLREANRCWVQRLHLLAPCRADLDRADRSDVQRLEYLVVHSRNACPRVDERLPDDRRWHSLILLLQELNQTRVQRDLDRKEWARELERSSARLGPLRAGLLLEHEGVMDGHESGRG